MHALTARPGPDRRQAPMMARLATVLLLAALGAAGRERGPVDEALALADAGRTADAIEVLRTLRTGPSPPPDALALLGALLLQVGRPAEAAEVLEPLTGSDDADPVVLYNAARACLAMHQEERAQALLLRSIERAPVTPATLLFARLQADRQRHEVVVAMLLPIVDGAPIERLSRDDPALAADLALLYARSLVALGRAAPAADQLRRVALQRPDDPEVFQLLGQTLADLGAVDEARRALERSQQLSEAGREAEIARRDARRQAASRAQELLRSAFESHRQGHKEQALGTLREAMALAPDSTPVRAMEVRLLVELERFDEARRSADELVTLSGGGAEPLQLRGTVRLAQHDAAAAEEDFRRALTAEPDHLGALNGLALSLLAQQRLDEAREVLDRAVSRWPDDPVAAQIRSRLTTTGG